MIFIFALWCLRENISNNTRDEFFQIAFSLNDWKQD
eukprot:UN06376